MVERANYKVDKVIDETADVKTVHLLPPSGKVFQFLPGQYVNLSMDVGNPPKRMFRPYSMSSSPTDESHLAITFKIVDHESAFSKALGKIQPGAELGVMGPMGLFTFDETKHQEVMMIAGGVGITPFRSMVRYATHKKLSNKLTLLFSNKTAKDLVYMDELRALEKQNPNFKCAFTVTREEPPAGSGIESGRFDEKRILADCGGSIEGKYFMICGSNRFVEGFKQMLLGMGVPKDHVLYELFGNSV